MRHKDENLLDAICKFAKEFVVENSHSPSTKDVAEEFNVSRMTASRYLSELKECGRIAYENGIISVSKLMQPSNIPVIGSVPCGEPQLEEENIMEYIPLPRKLIGKGEFFALYADGESMTGAGINSGDLVVVRKQQTADFGNIVVALVDNENTLKTLKYDEELQRPYLHPENDAFDDIYDGPLVIQGVAVYVLKSLM